MATPLDLEEQEQLDQIKHFWNVYGTLITWAVLIVAGGFIAWNGWQYLERSKAAQASALFDEIERSVKAGDTERVDRAFKDMKEKFSRTAYAQQAGLAVAKLQFTKGNAEGSRAALSWVAEHAVDTGYQAVAKLRLASEQMEAKAYDDALKTLGGAFPAEFEGLVADRKGDVLLLQGKREDAATQYKKAWNDFGTGVEYRRLVEVKLNAIGIDPKTLVAAAGSDAATSAASSAATKATP